MAKRAGSRAPRSLGAYVRLKDALNSTQAPRTATFDGKLSKILVAPQDHFGKKLRQALRIIDSVHTVGGRQIPHIEIVETRDRTTLGNLVCHSGTGDPLRLEISNRNEQPEFTLLHEVGHFLEHAGIPGANFGGRRWGFDPYLDRVLDCANASECVSRVRALAREPADPSQVRAFAYLLNPKEIWARAYAQFIATRSENPKLLGFLERRRSPDIPNPIQWKDGDFAPIERAIESLFRELGWFA